MEGSLDRPASGPTRGQPADAGGLAGATTGRDVAAAALAGWLPLVVINAYFVRRVRVQLDPTERLLHHLYDAGQLLGLGVLCWLALRLLWKLPRWPRLALAAVLAGGAHYALLASDLESFLTRHADSGVPWHVLFAVLSAGALVTSYMVGLWLGRRPWGVLGALLGLALGVGNHLVLALDYPGVHFVLAWTAAGLIGMSALSWLARMGPRTARVALGAACLLSLPSYLLLPSMSVRAALLGSSGAVAAPFVAQAWAQFPRRAAQPAAIERSAWFAPRHHHAPVPPEVLPGAPPEPIVILLTVDALRADVVDTEGEHREVAPNLVEMGEQGLELTRAWSAAPYTMASIRSMFIGIYYLQQQGRSAGKLRHAIGQKARVGARPYLAAMLERAGVTTVNLKTHAKFTRDGGICRGFGEEANLGSHAPAKKVVAGVLKRLGDDPQGPLFIYSHIFDPHSPYNLGGDEGPPWERYLAEVSMVDRAIGTLRRELRKRGLHNRTYLIVTSDHGEAFGEHGRDFHATTVYEEMIRIPLLIEGPGVGAHRVDRPAGLIDVAPTILSLFGQPTPGYVMGQSLVPFMRGERPELSRPLAVDGGRAMRAMLFEQRWKAMVDEKRGTEEVYDLREDPEERRNLAEQPHAQQRIATLRAFFKGLNPSRK
ncbi:MAG: sulfatase [Myxococcales bacterium]|nr:sulfatase [Myxococcales bacterium]